MPTTENEKSSKFRGCWYAYKLPSVIAWCPLLDAAHATSGSTNY